VPINEKPLRSPDLIRGSPGKGEGKSLCCP
jgi:hypothetical protein